MRVTLTLSELLIVVMTVGLGLASLRAGGALAAGTLCIALTVILGIVIVAFVGSRGPKAFATGFSIPVLAYAVLHIGVGDAELDPYRGALPTTQMLRPLFQRFVHRTWVDGVSGDELPDYLPSKLPARHEGGPLPPGVSPVRRAEVPSRATFMTLGHVLLAMLLGYAGGKFAVAVHDHDRRQATKIEN